MTQKERLIQLLDNDEDTPGGRRMSTYAIQIDDNVVNEQISSILNDILYRQLRQRTYCAGKELSDFVKEVVYSRKDEIIEMVVERAVKEISKKALPKLLERMGGTA